MTDLMMLPAERHDPVLAVVIMAPVISHADRIHMMDVSRSATDAALPIPNALHQICINIICPLQA